MWVLPLVLMASGSMEGKPKLLIADGMKSVVRLELKNSHLMFLFIFKVLFLALT
jgi:hypothetical protein